MSECRLPSVFGVLIMAEVAEGEVEAEELAWRDCLGQQEASDLDNTLFFDYEYSIDQLMEIAGLCVAQVGNPMVFCFQLSSLFIAFSCPAIELMY